MTTQGGTSCRSCGATTLAPLLHWPSIPVNAALFPESREESLSIARGSFRLVVCETCGLVFNAEHDERLVEYSTRCIETPTHSPHHRAFADALALDWVKRHELRGEPVVEVGCGHAADFLYRLLELGVSIGTCVDPACEIASSERLRVHRERFADAHAELPGRALVCRHTLEHVPDVRAFLGAVRTWSSAKGSRVALFEVPDAERIFDDGAFWDVYYEHCSYFTAATLETAFRVAGLEPMRVEHVYDGQYLVLEARPGPAVEPDPAIAAPVVRSARAFAAATDHRVAQAARSLRALRADGGLALWQAGGKALALLTLTDATDLVAGVVDVNPGKRGRFLPGTGVEILAPADLADVRPKHVVVMNAVYLGEIRETLVSLGIEASVSPVESLFAERERA